MEDKNINSELSKTSSRERQIINALSNKDQDKGLFKNKSHTIE